MNSGSFRQWPGLVDVAWARVAGRDSVCLKLTYESHVALEQNYDRWVAAAEMMERSFLTFTKTNQMALRRVIGPEERKSRETVVHVFVGVRGMQ